jgi:hypothetical protein
VIGFFPTKFDPSVPDVIMIEKNDVAKIMSKVHSVERPCTREDRRAVSRADLWLGSEEWVVLEEGKLKPISTAEIGRWRDRIAAELVQKATEMKGDPLRVLNMLESAANLRSLSLPDFALTLSKQRASKDETLSEVFLRVRDNQGEGQKGP